MKAILVLILAAAGDPALIDREAGPKPMLTVRLVKDGQVARTWLAVP